MSVRLSGAGNVFPFCIAIIGHPLFGGWPFFWPVKAINGFLRATRVRTHSCVWQKNPQQAVSHPKVRKLSLYSETLQHSKEDAR